MGSSAKKKAEKKKDFKKEKLKVGKQRPKASNVTDTSFRSKGIVLREQMSHALLAPAAADQFAHHLSLLSSRSESQRRDSLSFLATFLASRAADEPPPRPICTLLTKLLPVSLDRSDGVRNQLLRALRAFRHEELQCEEHKILLYVRAGMTHIDTSINDTSMDILAWALRAIPEELVTSPGGWIKMLRHFAVTLRWSIDEPNSTSNSYWVDKNARLLVKVLGVLGQYLRAGLETIDREPEPDWDRLLFPIVDFGAHRLPSRPNAFAYLNLFSSHQTDDDKVYLDRADRRADFQKELQDAFAAHLSSSKKLGGELGRAAGQVEAIISEGMMDYDGF